MLSSRRLQRQALFQQKILQVLQVKVMVQKYQMLSKREHKITIELNCRQTCKMLFKQVWKTPILLLNRAVRLVVRMPLIERKSKIRQFLCRNWQMSTTTGLCLLTKRQKQRLQNMLTRQLSSANRLVFTM